MLSNSKVPKCVVLMASYNGIPFISEQIDSILSQAEVDVRLFVRDDGSSDGTRDLLQRYADEGSLTLLTGENLGPALGFLTLLRNAPEADYYAFSDQDDIWDSDKLITAIKQLKKQENLALYHCNSRLVDSAGNEMAPSALPSRPDRGLRPAPVPWLSPGIESSLFPPSVMSRRSQ